MHVRLSVSPVLNPSLQFKIQKTGESTVGRVHDQPVSIPVTQYSPSSTFKHTPELCRVWPQSQTSNKVQEAKYHLCMKIK